MDWVWFSIFVYIWLGGLIIAPSYQQYSKIKDRDKKLARAILLIVGWGPAGICLAIIFAYHAINWLAYHAFKENK